MTTMEQKTGSSTFGWLLAIAGALLLCWAIYGVICQFTYCNIAEPLRTGLVNGEVEIARSTATTTVMWLNYILSVGIGIGLLYAGIKRIRNRHR